MRDKPKELKSQILQNKRERGSKKHILSQAGSRFSLTTDMHNLTPHTCSFIILFVVTSKPVAQSAGNRLLTLSTAQKKQARRLSPLGLALEGFTNIATSFTGLDRSRSISVESFFESSSDSINLAPGESKFYHR